MMHFKIYAGYTDALNRRRFTPESREWFKKALLITLILIQSFCNPKQKQNMIPATVIATYFNQLFSRVLALGDNVLYDSTQKLSTNYNGAVYASSNEEVNPIQSGIELPVTQNPGTDLGVTGDSTGAGFLVVDIPIPAGKITGIDFTNANTKIGIKIRSTNSVSTSTEFTAFRFSFLSDGSVQYYSSAIYSSFAVQSFNKNGSDINIPGDTNYQNFEIPINQISLGAGPSLASLLGSGVIKVQFKARSNGTQTFSVKDMYFIDQSGNKTDLSDGLTPFTKLGDQINGLKDISGTVSSIGTSRDTQVDNAAGINIPTEISVATSLSNYKLSFTVNKAMPMGVIQFFSDGYWYQYAYDGLTAGTHTVDLGSDNILTPTAETAILLKNRNRLDYLRFSFTSSLSGESQVISAVSLENKNDSSEKYDLLPGNSMQNSTGKYISGTSSTNSNIKLSFNPPKTMVVKELTNSKSSYFNRDVFGSTDGSAHRASYGKLKDPSKTPDEYLIGYKFDRKPVSFSNASAQLIPKLELYYKAKLKAGRYFITFKPKGETNWIVVTERLVKSSDTDMQDYRFAIYEQMLLYQLSVSLGYDLQRDADQAVLKQIAQNLVSKGWLDSSYKVTDTGKAVSEATLGAALQAMDTTGKGIAFWKAVNQVLKSHSTNLDLLQSKGAEQMYLLPRADRNLPIEENKVEVRRVELNPIP